MKDANDRAQGGIRGTDLMIELQERGWHAFYINPDINDRDPEARASRRKAHDRRRNGNVIKGKYYGLTVNEHIENYRNNPPDANALTKLKALPFGVMALKGGKHMAIITKGMVFEVHWDEPATSGKVIEASKIEDKSSSLWKSGAIVIPKEDVKLIPGRN